MSRRDFCRAFYIVLHPTVLKLMNTQNTKTGLASIELYEDE